MHLDDRNTDLRMLSLLHAMRDTEGFVQEAIRLKESKAVDNSIWRRICDMGRELMSAEALFATPSDYPENLDMAAFDRRKQDRRVRARRIIIDRRERDRRMTVMPWLGSQRRGQVRRQHTRRQTDLG